jgi:FKBP-type peptidyl-prolyl cis-trans isomerase FkpA
MWLANGTLLSSSYPFGRPETFPVGGPAVAGWTEGIQLMKEGSTYEFVIPPTLAYGSQDREKIPANSTIVLHVELLKVE